MNKIIINILLIFIGQISFGQVVINEIDCDSPGIDDKEFIELKSAIPKMSLEGFALVLFNGSTNGGNRSYFVLDLDEYTTDVNGLLLIGSNNVSPVPQLRIFANVIQNGADAVGIYRADTTDFPDRTLAHTNNLIDALAYDTNDPDATTLMNLLGLKQQLNEGANGNKNTESIQRNNDGSYFVGKPTPRQLNDGSGINLNGISISTTQSQFNEGDEIEISFFAERTVDRDLIINYSLNNQSFDQSDYMGNTTLIIPKGGNMATSTIQIIDDQLDEGDEEMIINMSTLSEEFLELNDNLLIRIIDNDFAVAPWGSPIDPSFGIVKGTQSSDYYNSLLGLRDLSLRKGLQNIIANPNIVRTQTYSDIIDILKEADKNPKNSNQVWLLYTEQGRAILDFQTTSNNKNKWNREHTFPRSRGGFFSIREDMITDGIDIYWTTNADSLRHGNSDAHALRATDGAENSSRGNKHYGQYTGPVGNKGSFRGDVARSVLYMAVRYNGLEIVNGYPDIKGQLGDLETLLEWHRNDPPDDFEMNRNNVIYKWQFNRNPFIDYPELIEHIWGKKKGEIWDMKISSKDIENSKIKIFPNPSGGIINISDINNAFIKIYTEEGKFHSSHTILDKKPIEINLTRGVYFITINENNRLYTSKIVSIQ